jgi:hypothetical protein
VIYVYHIDFSNISKRERLNRRLYDIVESEGKDIVWRLQMLEPDFDSQYKFTSGLFCEKFNRGHVIFLWDDVEAAGDDGLNGMNTKKSSLLDMIKEIKDGGEGKKKNLQWVVSDKAHVRKREAFFGCISYRFVRVSCEKNLRVFYEQLKISECAAGMVNERLVFKFQRFVEVKNEFSSFRSVVSFTTSMLTIGSIYRTFEVIYNDMKLSEHSVKALRYVVVKSAIGPRDRGHFTDLDVMQLKENSLQHEQLVKLGILRKFKSIDDFQIARDFSAFVLAKYFVENILNPSERLRNRDRDEVALRVQLLFKVVSDVRFRYVRKILIDYLLLNVNGDEIHEFFEDFLVENFKVKEKFLNLSGGAKIFLLHFFKKSQRIFDNLSNGHEEIVEKLQEFLDNEGRKKTDVDGEVDP